jgi:hypothetical protein
LRLQPGRAAVAFSATTIIGPEGEEVSGHHDENNEAALSEKTEYELNDARLSPNAAKLLWPRRRSSLRPLMIFILLAPAIGFIIFGTVNVRKSVTEVRSLPPPKQPDRTVQELAPDPIEPFRSLALDAAQSYLASVARLPVATVDAKANPGPMRGPWFERFIAGSESRSLFD